MKVAVIGIGSNSVRSLTAEVGDGRFARLDRDREGTRLFAGMDEAGRLSEESMRKTVDAVGRMALCLRDAGVERLHVFATSAARDAANGAEFSRRVKDVSGEIPEIISGEREAELSFLGARCAAGDAERCGMIDIGGGSTEIAAGNRKAIEIAFSCQMGAVRLYEQLPIRACGDMAAAEARAREILRSRMAETGRPEPPEAWVGTGGTFTTLAAMIRKIRWTDRTYMHGTRLGIAAIRDIGGKLADMTLEERKQLPGLQPHRADIVVHGICILLAVMEELGIPEITVSEYGNLDGYLLDRYGA